MKINKISFTGKAYFLDNIEKSIKPEHKTRIQNYAQKLDEDTDVVVFGQEIEQSFIYKGRAYSRKDISADWGDDDIKLKIKTPNGVEKVGINEVANNISYIPIYNAFVLSKHNKENMGIPPYRKQFDFTKEARNTIIRPDSKIEPDDIEY